jgi:hypothetical protein
MTSNSQTGTAVPACRTCSKTDCSAAQRLKDESDKDSEHFRASIAFRMGERYSSRYSAFALHQF